MIQKGQIIGSNDQVSAFENFTIANPISITPSLRGATLVATKQSIKVTKNGLLRRLMPPRNDLGYFSTTFKLP